MAISNLAYVGLGVSDVSSWTSFARDILGFATAGAHRGGEEALRFDGKPWRIALSEGADNDISYVGFEAADAQAVARLADHFGNEGIATRPMSSAEADAREAGGGIVLSDPDGLRVEVVYGFADCPTAFRSPVGAEFVTGDQGLGHLVVSAPDIERSLKFYRLLGFEITDYIETNLGPDVFVRLVFLHCNARHHTLALLPLPTPKRLNHLMFETKTVDSVLQAYYRAKSAGLPIVRHIGRHTNDRMLSFYAKTPAGFDVEYGCDGVQVGSNWPVKTYDAISLWGHEP
ncbi:MAG TPA: VOC family protein [Rhizomicrobium sp.]|jgi:biphenyl-2,3-diol 1,2-dioxygenase|nr:VOC family protein [Rhizomicrobium sp.]